MMNAMERVRDYELALVVVIKYPYLSNCVYQKPSQWKLNILKFHLIKYTAHIHRPQLIITNRWNKIWKESEPAQCELKRIFKDNREKQKMGIHLHASIISHRECIMNITRTEPMNEEEQQNEYN